MANQVTLTFGGDADQLVKAAKKASAATEDVAGSVGKSSASMVKATTSSGNLLDRFSKLGNAVSGAGDAIDSASGLLADFTQIQNQSYEKAQAQKRALVDVQQAQEDYNQALRDSKQAAIDSDQAQVDLAQANLDASTALKAYNTAVKEHGKNSAEAAQASIDLRQAGVDVKQAQEDQAQSTRDASQATIDATDAQLNLSDAQRNAHPPDVAKWSQDIQTFAPLLSGLVGITGLVTAAQWAWNAAQLASPTTWIILGIVALVAVIVLIATKTKWFQTAWTAAWGWIKHAASNTVDFMKKIPGWIGIAFSKVSNAITAPFRAAFNLVADAWNNTVGGLSWTVPGWVPFVGGNTISAPHLPHFHSGGTVPGIPGSETLAVLQAGERVSTRGGGDRTVIEIRGDGSALADGLVEILSKAVRNRGGNVQLALGGRNA
jgi:hypothetical protein